MQKAVALAALAAVVVVPSSAMRAPPRPLEIAAADSVERMRVLWIGAHPDDEDTNLIAWLARGRNVETAYMSLTRGDGGQNLIGNELGEALGVIRTEELLAARRIDGAHQYFGREYDFGFSKSAEETLRHWPRDSVLNDVMTVVRAFRPHIMITTFSGTPRDGHGHHQVSAIIAREVYDRAADTVRFPVSRFGKPWIPLKLYRLARFSPQDRTLAINVGEYNPYLGLSYQEIAADSRSQHKSQGEGTLRRKGVVWDYLMREDSRVPAPPAKEEKSIFAGLDTTKLLVQDGRVTPPALPPAVQFEAVADRQALADGEVAQATLTIYNRSSSPISFRHPMDGEVKEGTVLPDSSFRWTENYQAGITQPWWLRYPRMGDLFNVKSERVSEEERDQTYWERAQITENGRMYTLSTPVVFHFVDRVRGDVQRPLIVAPGISIALDQAVTMARVGAPLNQLIKATLRSAYADSTPVTVRLVLPRGLAADSVSRSVTMAPGGTRTLTFRLSGILSRGVQQITATAT
ncbi:MAG TPA: PIG-L family deacetylase, partial [Gemmatimonadaceae bacterium]|nr:PIG-L family deacetylase [Gemmatimonadaceae bacterium]